MMLESFRSCSLVQEIIVGCMPVESFHTKKAIKGAEVTARMEQTKYSRKVCFLYLLALFSISIFNEETHAKIS